MRIAFLLIITLVLMVFVSQNLTIVPVHWVIGPAVEMPLIEVVGISFVAGFVFAIVMIYRRVMRR